MFTAVIVLHVIVSIVLIITVLLQSGKGASIGAAFGGAGSQTLFGSAGPASFLLKITVVSAVIFMSTSMYMTLSSGGSSVTSVMSEVKGAPVKQKSKAVKKTAAKDAKEPVALKKIEEQALKPAPIVGKKAVKSRKDITSKKTAPLKKKAVKSKKTIKKKTAPKTVDKTAPATTAPQSP